MDAKQTEITELCIKTTRYLVSLIEKTPYTQSGQIELLRDVIYRINLGIKIQDMIEEKI